MAVRDPFLIDQGNFSVMDVNRGAALVPAGFRAQDRRITPGLSVVVAPGDEKPA
jgi:hypothetical protein